MARRQATHTQEGSWNSTVVSYPTRGKEGDSRYRGNCGATFLKGLYQTYSPNLVWDVMTGGLTGVEVAAKLGIPAIGTDLNPLLKQRAEAKDRKNNYPYKLADSVHGGWDALTDDIPKEVLNKKGSMFFWHPPYWDIIKYSGNMWGEKDTRDLSQRKSWRDFIADINKVLAKLYSFQRPGGRIAILVGDIKRKGVLYSMQREMDWYGQPEQVIIKMQHNCWSDSRTYSGGFVPLRHEYLIVLKKNEWYAIPALVTREVQGDIRKAKNITWRDLVMSALGSLGGKATLDSLYNEVQDHDKTKSNNNWQAKVRQTLQRYDEFSSARKRSGVWQLQQAA